MRTFKINVKKVTRGKSAIYVVTTNRGRESLLAFMPGNVSPDLWYFNIPENQERVLFHTSDTTPVGYLLELCRAILVIRYGETGINIELTTTAKELLKNK